MEYKDYYSVLGVQRDADDKAIKRAFRKLARQHHPDVNPGNPAAEARFKEIAEAYEVLGDPEKRAKYDRFGREWQQYERAGGAPGGFDWSSWGAQPGAQPGAQGVRYATPEEVEEMFAGAGGGFSDFFEQLFGRSAARQPARRPGIDLNHPVQVTLDEAYRGTTRSLSKDGRRIEVRIPPGVRTGSKVRMKGEGIPGSAGGPPGDLYLEIEVLPDKRFERVGNDLHTTVEVPLTTAVLGGEVTVPTPAGNVKLTVPANTQNGRRFRLTGKGMPKLRTPSEHGDLYATTSVQLPTRLGEEERKLFERLRELHGD